MAAALIYGIGNSLRRDDGVGAMVCDWVQEMAGDRVEAHPIYQLTPELCEPISRAGLVVFVDASASDDPGLVRVSYLEPHSATPTMTHYVTPEGLLAAAQSLYGTHPRAVLVTIGGKDFDFGEGFSPEVERAVDEACVLILTQILA